jgi:hypothetical protein
MKSKQNYVKNTLAPDCQAALRKRMTKEHHRRVVAWIRSNLARQRMTVAELSRRIGIEQSKILHGLGKAERRFPASEIEKMEKVFKNSFSNATTEMLNKVAIVGKSEASYMLLGQRISLGFSDMKQAKTKVEIPTVRLDRYLDARQEAWPIEDDSCDKYLTKGMYAVTVPYFEFRPAAQVGDKVVVKRYHPILFANGDVTQSENTIRLITRESGKIVLKSLSTNVAVKDIPYNPDDKSVEIVKLVIGAQFYEAY